jgi:hypothetical protein
VFPESRVGCVHASPDECCLPYSCSAEALTQVCRGFKVPPLVLQFGPLSIEVRAPSFSLRHRLRNSKSPLCGDQLSLLPSKLCVCSWIFVAQEWSGRLLHHPF